MNKPPSAPPRAGFDHDIICPHCGAVMEYNQVSEGRLQLVKRMSPDLSMTNLRAKCGRGFYECPRGCMFKWVSEIGPASAFGGVAGERG